MVWHRCEYLVGVGSLHVSEPPTLNIVPQKPTKPWSASSACALREKRREANTTLACDPMEAQLRVATLHQHLVPAAKDAAGVHINPTAAEPELEYSVALPERLTPSGPWLVHRCACKPVGRGSHPGA